MLSLPDRVPLDSAASPEMEVARLLKKAEHIIRSLQSSMVKDGCKAIAASDHQLVEVQQALSQAVFVLKRHPNLDKDSVGGLASELQREVDRLAVMLDQALRFYSDWMDQFQVSVSGYTANGAPAQDEFQQRLSIKS